MVPNRTVSDAKGYKSVISLSNAQRCSMFILIVLWLLVPFLPIACINLVESTFDRSELGQMGIRIP
jgi:hypothetical protein